ncbi:Mur ligase family protein [Kitasatospora azatica]|uniref:Mur ligase family protein n=1 Tax=Kitasatospora azatica TaxID=58347 RepID=UPI00068FB54F|nr:Mur ligase family protein [Kitasatospora azatica]
MTLREVAVLCADLAGARSASASASPSPSPAASPGASLSASLPLVVALAGAVGKRSTTALLARLLAVAPAPATGGGAPSVAVVLNVGCTQGASKQASATALGTLLDALPADGLAVLNADDPYALSLAARSNAPVLTFGRTSGDVRAAAVTLDQLGRPSFTLTDPRGAAARVRLGLPGADQVSYAAAAAAVALGVGLGIDRVAAALGGRGEG